MTQEDPPDSQKRPHRPRPRLGPTARLVLLSAGILAAAAALWLMVADELEPLAPPFELPFWAIAVGAALTSMFAVRIEFRRDTVEFSFNEMALVVGFFFAQPWAVLLGYTIGRQTGQTVHDHLLRRRQPVVRELFDVVSTLLVVSAGLSVFHLLGPADKPLAPTGLLAALLAVSCADLLRGLLIDLGMLTSGIGLDLQRWRENLTFGLGVTLATASLGLLAVMLLWRDATTSWLLLLPAALVALVYHASTRDRRQQDSLQFLYEITQLLQYGKRPDDIARVVLSKAREAFRAERAELVLRPGRRRPGRPAHGGR